MEMGFIVGGGIFVGVVDDGVVYPSGVQLEPACAVVAGAMGLEVGRTSDGYTSRQERRAVDQIADDGVRVYVGHVCDEDLVLEGTVGT